MLQKYSFAIFILLFLSAPAFSQNLIPDPGFEIWDGTVGSPPQTLSPLTYWYNANGTADHHHQLNPPGNNLTSLEPCPTGSGQTQCGFPYEGMGVLGCWKGNGSGGSREWGGVQLTEPMVAGGCYEVSFWIQNKEDHPNYLMETNQWGIFFSQTQLPVFTANLANYDNMTDQWLACEEVVSGSEWQQFTFDYTASEDFKYAYVGYMGNVANSTYTAWSNDFLIGFYVWFDEIVVKRIDPQLTLTDDVTICLGDSVLLTAGSNFPVSWNDGMSYDTAMWVQPQQTTTYYVHTLDSTACTAIDSVTVTVIDNTQLALEADVQEGCLPLEVQFTDLSPVPGMTYIWDFGDGQTGNDLLSTAHIYEGEGSYSVSLTVEYFENCEATAVLENGIQVNAYPEAGFVWSPAQPSNLEPEVQFQNTSSENALEWFWDFGNGASSIFENPVYKFSIPGIYEVSLVASTAAGCKDTLVQSLLVDNQVRFYVPNIFSPNADGINDVFEVHSVGLIEAYQLTIFDRWGGMVFQSADVNDVWDGTFRGKFCPVGSYAYLIEYVVPSFPDPPQRKVLTGDVAIVR